MFQHVLRMLVWLYYFVIGNLLDLTTLTFCDFQQPHRDRQVRAPDGRREK